MSTGGRVGAPRGGSAFGWLAHLFCGEATVWFVAWQRMLPASAEDEEATGAAVTYLHKRQRQVDFASHLQGATRPARGGSNRCIVSAATFA